MGEARNGVEYPTMPLAKNDPPYRVNSVTRRNRDPDFNWGLQIQGLRQIDLSSNWHKAHVEGTPQAGVLEASPIRRFSRSHFNHVIQFFLIFLMLFGPFNMIWQAIIVVTAASFALNTDFTYDLSWNKI